jgi:hypothetical protein
MIKKTKAQITIFIIIGIVILLAASFFLYYRNFIFAETEIVPIDLVPVKDYVESCLDQVSQDAIVRLGMQSGYINIPNQVRLYESYIELIPNSPFIVPYWHYNGISFVPTISEMQNEISGYVRDNIARCVNFDVLKNDYLIESSEEISIETIIAEQDVVVSMEYPISITTRSTEEQSKISKFHVTRPVRLKKAFELARNILEAENSKTYLENITVDWMSMNRKIPLNGIEFHCKDLTWRVSDVQKQIQDTIYYNLPKVMIKNTNHPKFLKNESVYEKLREYTLEDINKGNYPDIETPADAYDYSHYLLDVRSPKVDLKAMFFYNPSWGIHVAARPSEDGIMRSTKQDGSEEFLSFFCLNTYHFNYDIVYPVEVLIRDDKAFNGHGFIFRYSFQVMINHNQPDRSGFLNPEFVMFGGSDIGACDDLDGQQYDIRTFGVDEFGIENMEIKDVNLTYDCYRFKCYLGKTKADEGHYRLRTQLPSSCSHGMIVAEKPGYLKKAEQVLESTDVDVNMIKMKKMKFDVVMNNYNSLNNEISSQQLVNSPIKAFINIQSIDEPSLSYSRRYPVEDPEQDMVEIMQQDSKYKLDIILVDEADSFVIGGYSGNWTASYDDIVTASKVRFHVANYLPKPMNLDAEQKAIRFIEQNNIYKERLQPELLP